MTRVYLIRHAETAVPHCFHGAESDVGLGARGHRQAALLAEHLAALQPDAIVSSSMARARDTALPIAGACGLELQEEPLLHERRMGELSGQPHTGNENFWTESLQQWLAGNVSEAVAGAESFGDMQRRLLPTWEKLVKQHVGKKLVIVAHGGVCKVLLCSLLPRSVVEGWQDMRRIRNGGITELLHAGSIWQAVRFNEQPASFQRHDVQ